MNDKILILFEETQKYKKEDLTQFISLNRKETLVSTLVEVLENKIKLGHIPSDLTQIYPVRLEDFSSGDLNLFHHVHFDNRASLDDFLYMEHPYLMVKEVIEFESQRV